MADSNETAQIPVPPEPSMHELLKDLDEQHQRLGRMNADDPAPSAAAVRAELLFTVFPLMRGIVEQTQMLLQVQDARLYEAEHQIVAMLEEEDTILQPSFAGMLLDAMTAGQLLVAELKRRHGDDELLMRQADVFLGKVSTAMDEIKDATIEVDGDGAGADDGEGGDDNE